MSTPLTASPQSIMARLERLDVWSLSYLFIGIIGTGFLFTFYDIFDINVSFIQTCVAIKPGCTPENALGSLGLPVLLNLAGYVVGTLVLSPIADRIGRRDMLMITMLITGIGSLYNVFVPDMANFVAARIVTGIGIGADLAIVNTYINEVAPRRGRAKYTSLIFTFSALGAFVGIWLGLVLTTPASPWPTGLPFAVAGPGFAFGWRVMYAVGALLALVAVLLRFRLPESPRWLLGRGRLDDAEAIVRSMEERASRHGTLRVPDEGAVREPTPAPPVPYREIFRNPMYVRRAVLLLFVWLTGYVTVYAYGAGFTSVLASLRYPPPEAGVIAAIGTLGFIACGVVAYLLVERLERQHWLPIATVITLVGAVVVAYAGATIVLSFLGAALIFFGFNFWVPGTYAWSAENFPTRARASGFALVDGIGHIGGGIGVLAIAPIIPTLSPLEALLLITGFMVVATVIAQFGSRTRGRSLDEVSP